MNALIQLWLPVLVAAVLVFVASSLIHMVFKWHNRDYRKLANEDDVQAAMRAGSPTPGLYTLPHCTDMKAMQEEPMLTKLREGPVVFMTVFRNGPPRMGASLLQWFGLNLAIAAIAAMLAVHVLGTSVRAPYAAHLAGVLAFLAYGGGGVQAGIWMGKPWGSVAKDLLDALIYGVVTALAFWWLWPGG
ncbi:hypothetical protein [Marilutibacter chinensis]|uniref:Integral membrane protein n=1 Tax=Marilutibacter chinensis TaxID=2912247 RepID=A0ABS9HUR6_9GAMM|nr:hypothetical protein [Lysobacter chinensis]MCF7222251.1 hypothetical protein [Lysobacter chinensis]